MSLGLHLGSWESGRSHISHMLKLCVVAHLCGICDPSFFFAFTEGLIAAQERISHFSKRFILFYKAIQKIMWYSVTLEFT